MPLEVSAWLCCSWSDEALDGCEPRRESGRGSGRGEHRAESTNLETSPRKGPRASSPLYHELREQQELPNNWEQRSEEDPDSPCPGSVPCPQDCYRAPRGSVQGQEQVPLSASS